jgi:hypothetical protein
VIPGSVVPGFVRGTLPAYWSANERAPFGPNFPTNRWRRPRLFHFRSRSKRVRIVHSSPLLLQKRLWLRELDKKTMLFFETTCISRDGTQPVHSRVAPAWKRHRLLGKENLGALADEEELYLIIITGCITGIHRQTKNSKKQERRIHDESWWRRCSDIRKESYWVNTWKKALEV